MPEMSLHAPRSQGDMVESYRQWIVDARGLAKETAAERVALARRFLDFLRTCGRDIADARPVDVDAFFAGNAKRWKRLTVRQFSGCLRDFLSYAAQRRWCAQNLSPSILSPRIYSQEGLPYHAPWAKVQEMLRSSAKDKSILGRRSHAMLMVLATYGIRSSEVVRLRLGDIDWRKETIFFDRSKGGRSQTMPLVPAVGDAIIRYIRNARHNEGTSDALFLRHDSPYGAINCHHVYQTVRKALVGVGVEATHLGPHCLRHSLATRLVNGGVSMKEVSEMLGHRSLKSTAIYAKVDLASLRAVADMDWEVVL